VCLYDIHIALVAEILQRCCLKDENQTARCITFHSVADHCRYKTRKYNQGMDHENRNAKAIISPEKKSVLVP
jgi:hypothetical protein